VDVDSAGNIYVAGLTSSTDFATQNALQPDIGGKFDGHIMKFDHNGQVLFATFWGGNNDEFLYRARLDAADNFCVLGQTFSPGLTLVDPQQADFGGASDVLLGKLSNDGSELLFSTFLGGSEAESGWDLDFDAAGNLFVVGNTRSTDFPVVDAMQDESGGEEDIFIAQYTSDGSGLLYSTYFGGEDFDNGYGLVVQPGGTVFLAGRSYSTAEFPSTSGAYQTAHGGGDEDAIVVNLLPTPRLRMETTGGQLQLSWPSTQPSFELQSVMQLPADENWSAVTDSPSVEQGRNVLSPASDEPQQYYRLILP
jgi:hypothetical protein